MNPEAICPDCGAQFDTTEEINIPLSPLRVWQCGNCGHFIYQYWSDEIDEEEEVE